MGPTGKLALSLIASTALVGTTFAAPVAQGGMKFSMTLSDEAEVPGPGDPNASGTANITINPGQSRVCWEITTAGIDPGYSVVAGSGGHIHRGEAGEAGPVAISLGVELNGTDTGCTTAPRALIDEIRKSPHMFYVNLHWADTTAPITLTSYASGGLRAQLEKNPRM